MTEIAKFQVDVESIKSKGPKTTAFEVRAYRRTKADPLSLRMPFSLFFEMSDPALAPLIGEGLTITVETTRVEAEDPIVPPTEAAIGPFSEPILVVPDDEPTINQTDASPESTPTT